MNDEELTRYSRQILLPELDFEGQEALIASHVLIIGLGGLGSPVLQYLSAAGVGQLTLVDHDVVELSNVQRQICHGTLDVGLDKVESAKQEAQRINPNVTVHCYSQKADQALLDELLPQVNLVIDCSDNFAIRYLLNDACITHETPWVSGAAVGLQGQVICFDPKQAELPCYRCLYPKAGDDQRNCANSGILAPVVGVIGCMQATEALKILTGLGEPIYGRLLTFDALKGEWRRWGLQQDTSCTLHKSA